MQVCVAEEAAKHQWCPFGRMAYSDRMGVDASFPVNRDAADYPLTSCIGSGCMAWRWARTHIKPPGDPEGADLVLSEDTHGYCGLAGKPIP